MNQLYYSFEKNVICHLKLNGKELIEPWGVEFADSSSFFSLEDGYGYRYRILRRTEELDVNSRVLKMRLELKEGLVDISLREWSEGPRSIRRKLELICLRDCHLMDFVLRYRFKKEAFRYGFIAGQKMEYDGTNIYHQHPVNTVRLQGADANVNVSVVDCEVAGEMRPLMYLRSGEGAWIVHARMLPEPGNCGKHVIKLCSRWFQTRPIPSILTKLLLRYALLKNILWYRGERAPYRNRIVKVFSPNAYFMAFLPKGSRLMWDVRCTVDDS